MFVVLAAMTHDFRWRQAPYNTVGCETGARIRASSESYGAPPAAAAAAAAVSASASAPSKVPAANLLDIPLAARSVGAVQQAKKKTPQPHTHTHAHTAYVVLVFELQQWKFAPCAAACAVAGRL
jgi:hypothetical protein